MPPKETGWDKTKSFSMRSYSYGKKGFDKAYTVIDKLGDPVNKLSNKIGCEAFWPMTLDKESDKCARILRSFCKDGFYANVQENNWGKGDAPEMKQKVLQKIPKEVIKNAKGLCIFTTMRTGLWMSGSGGSGIVIARIPETGEWSPPSGVLINTTGIGFLIGADIYDCVIVINTYEAMKSFKNFRCTLGGQLSAVAGPVGVGGVLDSEVHRRQQPIWSYMKSRGFYGGVEILGTVFVERMDENERFYATSYSANEIMSGKVRHPPPELKPLWQTIKAAQGDTDVDESLIPPEGETPGDMELLPPGSSTFGIPAVDDPDPYGVKALEAEGLLIREAGTKERPSQEVFEFQPKPTSPAFAKRASTLSHVSSRMSMSHVSHISRASTDRGVQTETDTKQDFALPSRSKTDSVVKEAEQDNEYDPENEEFDDVEVREAKSATISRHNSVDATADTNGFSTDSKRHSPTFTRAKLVNIPKRPPPPPLPPRNPQRPISNSVSSQRTSPETVPFPPLVPDDPVEEAKQDNHHDIHALTDGFTEVSLTNENGHGETTPSHPPHTLEESHVAAHSETTADEKDEFHSVHAASSVHGSEVEEHEHEHEHEHDLEHEHEYEHEVGHAHSVDLAHHTEEQSREAVSHEGDLLGDHEDHLYKEASHEGHVYKVPSQDGSLYQEQSSEDHREDHLHEDHFHEDHLQENHHDDHLHEDHLQGNHHEDHLHEDHLHEDHLHDDHHEEHLHEDHFHEDHLQENHHEAQFHEDHLDENHTKSTEQKSLDQAGPEGYL